MSVARFWREQQNRYNFVGTKCGSCGRFFFPPREICTDCRRKSLGKMENEKLSGSGKIVSYTIVHDAPDAFKAQVPYMMAIVELDEGPRITGQIVNYPQPDNDQDIMIGRKVNSVFRKISADGKSGIIHYGYKFKLID